MADKPYYQGCFFCKHLNDDSKSCTAYPDRIPLSIFSGEIKHEEVLPSQEGVVVFEPKTKQ